MKNNRGSIIIPLVVVMSIMMMTIAYYYTDNFELRRLADQRLLFSSGLKAHRHSIHAMIRSQNALIKTFDSPLNGDLSRCAMDPEYTCTQLAPLPLTLVGEVGDDTTPFVSANPTQGFTSDLRACTDFPSVTCVFQYRMDWYGECPPSSPTGCVVPDIYFRGELRVAPQVETVTAINPKQYEFAIKVK